MSGRLKRISRTAAAVRDAKAEVEKAKEAVEQQFVEIERLRKEFIEANDVQQVHLSARNAAEARLAEAEKRYNFYTAEAVYHPF
ncbi:hypothetical protein [Terriglobus aquaticus]|uniref:Uncharacterized protein n=1 Tax=Terriglobus aquaticus TaxID=940139 RepID=A0ABW9KIY8_9BACT|nr:hypothetical protein [Terriglobus aquaticus]